MKVHLLRVRTLTISLLHIFFYYCSIIISKFFAIEDSINHSKKRRIDNILAIINESDEDENTMDSIHDSEVNHEFNLLNIAYIHTFDFLINNIS